MKNTLLFKALRVLGLAFPLIMSAQEVVECNGHAEFCDRRYNEIVQINSHNATSYKFSPVQDQDRTIEEQLSDGIRVFKIPLHYGYINPLGYYTPFLKAYLEKLNKEIEDTIISLKSSTDEKYKTLAEKRAEVETLQESIDKTEKEIEEKKSWYNKLPNFSWSRDSKTLRALEYAAELGAFEAKKITLKSGKEIALKGLEIAQAGLGLLHPEYDPRIVELKAERAALQEFLRIIGNQSEWTILICHGLAKDEFLRNHFKDFANQAPEALKPFLQKVIGPLDQLEQAFIRGLYGSESEAGGLLPYPVCLLEGSPITLKNFLVKIKQFLDTNPHEVVTILLNDFTGDYDQIAKIFEESGILHYAHAQDREAPWPTFKELIQTHKRLIVFTDSVRDPNKIYPYAWLNNRRFFERWPGKEHMVSTDIFTNPNISLEEWGNFSYKDTEYPQNKILDIIHAVTPHVAGTKRHAAIINERSVLRNRMKRIGEAAQHIPNWISIDFYQYPHNDVQDVIDEINGVGKYKGKQLFNFTVNEQAKSS
jgi:hypothetical protein